MELRPYKRGEKMGWVPKAGRIPPESVKEWERRVAALPEGVTESDLVGAVLVAWLASPKAAA